LIEIDSVIEIRSRRREPRLPAGFCSIVSTFITDVPSMRLTLHTDYALRVLMLLGSEPEQLHTIEETAGRYGISRNHLMKVVQKLVQTGFIESIRGRHGGLRLARPASEIRIGDVVRHTEESFAIVECFDRPNNTCAIAGACRLRGVLHEATRAFLDVLDRYTLADMLGTPSVRSSISRLLVSD
jgi:Rrf2 family nitric oxide-sensitive transcriptional repressor